MSHSARRAAFVLSIALPASVLLLAQPSAYATTVSVPTVTHTVSGSVARTADLRLPAPAARLAAYWRGAPEARVTLAFSADGRTFSQPIEAGRDEVGEQRANGITYGSVQVAGGARVVRLTSDRPLARVWLDGMSDGSRVVKRVRVDRAAHASVPQPSVLSRAAWGADESLRFNSDGTLKQTPTYYAAKKLIVHHTDSTNDDPDPAATIRAIYRYHVQTQGWADIGYNFFVDESGRTWEGRWSRNYAIGSVPSGDDELGRGVTGAHTGGWNSGSVGVALLGRLVDKDATVAARSGLVDVLAWLSEKNGLDPKATTAFTNPSSGAVKTTQNIAGHRDYGATECPGGVFYATLPTLRSDVANRIAASSTASPSPTPEPTPTETAPADTTPPSTPSGLTGTTASRSVTLSWAASTGEPTGYEIHRSTGKGYALLGTTSGTSYKNGGLKAGRTYLYKVLAYDAAGNRSALSAELRITAK